MQNFFLLECHVCALYFWAHVHPEGEFSIVSVEKRHHISRKPFNSKYLGSKES